ncbi:WD40 repeat-like protein [Corynespora cassiicola Philippines]|uniref:WD40 repeat-like protein n=1 Tax=Corynespora cassiicola Philippines TaxID=1448308 RepID=A0A2T2NXS8_CORCC|nr:WD40 repeat-like protein [Corynespora cassiicola Philippines]
MSPDLHHECTRIPVTALATCGPFLLAADGPFLRFYGGDDFRLITTEQVFEAHTIHGASVYHEDTHRVIVVVWGGSLVRALEIDVSAWHDGSGLILHTSNSVKGPDWILDLKFGPKKDENDTKVVCGAVTAHNSLLEVAIQRQIGEQNPKRSLTISIVELTSSSRSILYSAHLRWEAPDLIIVAAGTAFGEIIYWSWTGDARNGSNCRTHRVFLGHEGSIFGVHISKEIKKDTKNETKRFIASCSDDRTIRIWDITDISPNGEASDTLDTHNDTERTRHTGFSNSSYDEDLSVSNCVAMGWGHISRVWTVRFLDTPSSNPDIFLSSSGEDATSRTWKLNYQDNLPCELALLDTAAYHSGKNIWSATEHISATGLRRMVCGSADSKIVAHPLHCFQSPDGDEVGSFIKDCAVNDIVSAATPLSNVSAPKDTPKTVKSSKTKEFFRSYTFVDDKSLILTANSGKVYLARTEPGDTFNRSTGISNAKLIDQLEDLSGYSVCTGDIPSSIAFLAGSRGNIYMYHSASKKLCKIRVVSGKVGNLFAISYVDGSGSRVVRLLATMVGQQLAELLTVKVSESQSPTVLSVSVVPTSALSGGLPIESMSYVATTSQNGYLLLGLRKGSIVAYHVPEDEPAADGAISNAEVIQTIGKVHGNEAVTSMTWIASPHVSTTGHLISVGRDGGLSVHFLDFSSNSSRLVHRLSLPIGPYIEGLFVRNGHVLVYGFSSKKFVLYDTTEEEEIMSVETGGAHRSWAFRPSPGRQGGGTLVWTRASDMHVCTQEGPNHQVVRTGGHGREIKSAAATRNSTEASRQIIATGAEDTDIKLFEYIDEDLVCRRTLRRHVTGIQHLKWSDDGEYLFSSGGCEEFYVWRVSHMPPPMGIGVICETVYTPESEHSDLRVMSFDVRKVSAGFLIAMVFSDSSIKVYNYDSSKESPWQTLAKGVYFTSCLTQCVFLSSDRILTAGTDGHVVFWTLSPHDPRSQSDESIAPQTLTWEQPARIHQNTSKALESHVLDDGRTILVSGGDDGGLSFLVASSPACTGRTLSSPPMVVTRAHASAITACAIVCHEARIFILTSGNDEWIRLWEVVINMSENEDPLQIKRLKKMKTFVADVSDMAVLDGDDGNHARVLLCGVGMEVIRIDWTDL